jgi:hypothetical protein
VSGHRVSRRSDSLPSLGTDARGRRSLRGLADVADGDESGPVRPAADQVRQSRCDRAGGLELGPELANLGLHLGQEQSAAPLGELKLEDPLDPVEVDPLFLGQPLNLPQNQDVAQ